MAKIEQFKCDGCGKNREPSNHWWQITQFQGGGVPLLVQRMDADELEAFMKTEALCHEYEPDRHFCGQQCALAFISAQMAGGKG